MTRVIGRRAEIGVGLSSPSLNSISSSSVLDSEASWRLLPFWSSRFRPPASHLSSPFGTAAQRCFCSAFSSNFCSPWGRSMRDTPSRYRLMSAKRVVPIRSSFTTIRPTNSINVKSLTSILMTIKLVDWETLGPGILQLQRVPLDWYQLTRLTSVFCRKGTVSALHQLLFTNMARSGYSKTGHGVRYSSSSSESSFSSESGVESCGDSDASSDGLELGLSGKEAEQKFKRLRRIFLNRPTKAKKKEVKQQLRRNSNSRRSELERRPSKTSVTECRRTSVSSNSSSTSDGRMLERPSKPVNSVRPLQAAIDQHMHSLWEQLKRHSAQRDSTANQVQNMLEQAVDELQFLKKQEERALESQVRLIRESYALRLEVFQQQYLSKVAEIEDEMYASIQKRQQECDATVLAAAKKLQDQTQHTLLKDLSMVSNELMEEQLESSSTVSSSGSHSKVHRHRSVRSVSHSSNPSRGVSITKQSSPVSMQRAKLQALEQKLAAFSPESLTRVKSELATPTRRSNAERTSVRSKLRENESLPLASSTNAFARDADEWQASPLSPLRKGPSYWKNGISLEARGGREVTLSKIDDERAASTTEKRRAPVSLLSRRFLLPEEEEELRHLRTSIGLAKDWMATNNHV